MESRGLTNVIYAFDLLDCPTMRFGYVGVGDYQLSEQIKGMKSLYTVTEK